MVSATATRTPFSASLRYQEAAMRATTGTTKFESRGLEGALSAPNATSDAGDSGGASSSWRARKSALRIGPKRGTSPAATSGTTRTATQP